MKCLRIYADEEGESHLGEVEVPLQPFEIFPDVFLGMSPPIKATAVRIAVKPHGLTVADWHTSPGRQLVLWLTGWSEYETSDGDVRRVPAGSAVLSEDTRGKGHISRHPEEEQVLIFVAVPDGP